MARTRKRAPRPPAAAIVTPAVKTEDAMALDAGYTNTAATTAIHGIAELEPTDEIKPESRTVSPSPPSPSLPAAATRASATSITLHSLKYDFDGALMQEDPDFDEDFIPAEGEEIDMTSLAVAAPAPPDGEAATATTAPKRGIDDTDDTGTGVAFEDPAPASKRRRIDDSGDNELALTTTTPTTATAGATTSVGTSMGTLGGGITGHGGAGGSGGSTVDRLPMPLWIEIFTYIGLPGIGRLRAVCRRFDELLEKEHLWRRCRKIHCPDMPKPAFGVKEWDMWALVRGRGCMVCKAAKFEGKVRGEDGVKVYWQFRVRCCEGCFRRSVVKEADLSRLADEKAPAHVMKELVLALPYGLVDASFAWVPTTVPGPPADVERVYWGKDIEDIKQRYDEALQMDAAEEWLKGLEGEGFGHKADADRMEKWEVRVMQGNSYNPSAGAAPQRKNSGAEKGNGQGNALRNSNGIPVLVSSDNPPFQPQSIPTFYQRTRQYGDRSHQEVEDVKARRKADIEARCLKLSPPIPAEVLAHCSAFQASLKIAQPLTEQSWGALLVKILEQRAGAEEHERLRQAQRRQVEQQLEDRKLLESQERDQWVRKERQWEETQAPVRDMILRLADEEMKGWHGKVTFETAPAFAASVLTAVRTRYYEQGGVQETSPVSDSTPASSSSSAPSSTTMASAKPRPLVLENMKFLFDNKIKALTDPCRRELFFCRACKEIAGSPALSAAVGVTIPPPPKLYGFEGVIQHFAAKHTTDMSLGTVVVHWRSVWPEEAPFVVDPNEIKRLMTRPFGGGGGGVRIRIRIRIRRRRRIRISCSTMDPDLAHRLSSLDRRRRRRTDGACRLTDNSSIRWSPRRINISIISRDIISRYHRLRITSTRIRFLHNITGTIIIILPQTHALQPHPHHSHQAYPVSGPVPPFPTNDRNQHYPQHPQSGYPPQSGYHQHQQPPPHVQPPHQQQYSGYPPAYPQAPAPAHAQPQYNAYGQPVANSRPPAGAAYGAPMHQPVPAVPQPDPYEEAAKKEAEAAAAAAAAEKDRKDKIHYIADRAEQMWKNLGGTNKLLEPSIRALLMIHDTYAAFGDKYKGEKLSIQLFHEAIRAEIDGALKFMKLGNYNKFECRSCPKTSTRSFTLPLLFQHFESVHVARPSLGPSATGQGVKPKRFDWLVDMIRLPAEEEVSKMASGRGFDRKRMAAVEKVYPGVFDKKVEAAAESVATAPSKKHASKASMSAAEDFLNNLLPGGAPVSSSAAAQTGGKVDAKKDSSASDGPGSRDNDRSVSTPATVGTNKAAATPHRPQSRPRMWEVARGWENDADGDVVMEVDWDATKLRSRQRVLEWRVGLEV
ncbi:hypothetical protein DRE_00975 [Drechslerella stenobrocha 248]|uniref:F-box domain-containing protein n=1 Tax=Drechslerella stenobrocha 248 TaxID=1043628 RepID=W7HLN1_9PEZI|nr:hypothetical protein DRE_00975 [Drechslerella stenobrocha 248]